MKRFLAALLAGVALAGAGHAFASDQDTQWTADAKAFDAAAARGDCDAGLPAARRLIALPRFGNAPVAAQLAILKLGAICAWRTDGMEPEAFEDARRATDLPDADDDLWLERLELGAYLHRPDDVASTVEALASQRPRALDRVSTRLFARVLAAEHAVERKSYAERILNALEIADYRPMAPGERADKLWLRAAAFAVSAGDTAHATALLRRIDGAMLMQVRLDGRYTAIVRADPGRFEVVPAVERELAADQAAMAAHPDRLAPVREVLSTLRGLGRYDEALALAQSALDRIAASAKPAFADQSDQLNWILDQKAEILIRLGRVDEALAAERRGASTEEEGTGGNVSQTINLAGLYVLVDRPHEALTLLPSAWSLPHASLYGVAWVHAMRACALQTSGRPTELEAERAYLAAHAADNPEAALYAALCANDLDSAAAMVIAQLQDDEDRGQALVNLCPFAPLPHPSSFEESMERRRLALSQRPDVRAAIAKAGHVEPLPLAADVFNNLF
ncbi:hypothetical protein ACO2Q3_03600 [Caulobacter sp. KR2-114]|uniref:hypothetical protein n=1 Tax=Caulobacter sp. KR2-114 TaxID=3400912 RepID=UPI003C04A355